MYPTHILRAFFFLSGIFAVTNAVKVRSIIPTPSDDTPAPTPAASIQCNGGSLLCCNNVEPARDAGFLLSLLGIVLQDLDVLVGVTCSALTSDSAESGSCNFSPVCCENNSFGGLIAIGCEPVNINL
ncbi:fungal hydrophobin [Fomitiporia mediterranea MF3/22]|uniref:fungal hydrophobin n=1 Tax=Fomitiporia mediterranea (strain MF3/22) TaxID=694068 RepID=UPI000440760B|nr:fungal hydrophobin [Fomitiporia mediterranea MF3/22]EJD00316.1 fungal hydrophobin [Fomitiporia mediterranea MF3/22]